jgi:hypothetical protein
MKINNLNSSSSRQWARQKLSRMSSTDAAEILQNVYNGYSRSSLECLQQIQTAETLQNVYNRYSRSSLECLQWIQQKFSKMSTMDIAEAL